jgi:mRNA interferase MazF
MRRKRANVARINRGEVWLVDLGYAAKIRPCLVLSVPPEGQERVLVTLAPHTTSVRGTRFEVIVPKPFLKAGAFDAQGLVTVPSVHLIRKLGELAPSEMALVEEAVRRWLGFKG